MGKFKKWEDHVKDYEKEKQKKLDSISQKHTTVTVLPGSGKAYSEMIWSLPLLKDGKYEDALEEFFYKTKEDPFAGISRGDFKTYTDLFDIRLLENKSQDRKLASFIKKWISEGRPKKQERPVGSKTPKEEIEETDDNPKDVKTWLIVATCYNCLNRHKDAIIASYEALEIDPNNAFAWHQKAVAYTNLNMGADALECCNTSSSIDPDFTDPLITKCFIFHKLSKFKEALECSELAIKMNDENFAAWNCMGWELRNLNKNNESKEAYEKSLRLCEKRLEKDPVDRHALYYKSNSSANLGKKEISPNYV